MRSTIHGYNILDKRLLNQENEMAYHRCLDGAFLRVRFHDPWY